jgi:hypothetical protein
MPDIDFLLITHDHYDHLDYKTIMKLAVALASILIPLHHKLQHLLTHQMVIKNKRLRLAAAERTVAKLKEDKDLIADRF